MIRPHSLTSCFSLALCLVALAGPARAQDPDAPLSRREQAYVDDLGRRFGQVSFADRSSFAPGAREVVAPIGDGRRGRPDGAPVRPVEPTPMARGLLVRAGDTTIARYKFDSPEQAQAEARRVMEAPPNENREPLVGEVRGEQVLVLSGEIAKDPAAAREALDAAWQGLPAAASPDATFAVLGPRDLVLTTTLTDGPLRESVDQAIARARASADRPGFETTPDGARVGHGTDGLQADLSSGPQGATARVSGGPAGLASQEYLALLTPTADARSADQVHDADQVTSEGARRVIDRLFE